MEIDIQKLQDALTKIATVCEAHVATGKEHANIANAIDLITKTLSGLINERNAPKKEQE